MGSQRHKKCAHRVHQAEPPPGCSKQEDKKSSLAEILDLQRDRLIRASGRAWSTDILYDWNFTGDSSLSIDHDNGGL